MDRFVAPRPGTLDRATAFDLLHDVPSVRRALFQSGTSADRDAATEEGQRNYSTVLRAEMFGREGVELPGENVAPAGGRASPAPAHVPGGLFAFPSPAEGGGGSPTSPLAKRVRLTGAGDSPERAVYSSSPLRMEAQQLLLSPKSTPRQIARTPVKVLDAPELQDDFYLNLVDWSSQNVLAVGLKNAVYLWSANTSKVVKLCELEHAVGPVTAVSWMQRGSHLAIGTNRGMVQIWDVTRSKRVRVLTGHTQRTGCLSWNGSLLSSGSRDRQVIHRDVRAADDPVAVSQGHNQEVCGLRWSPNGQQLASGGNDNKLLVWGESALRSEPLHRFMLHKAAVKALAWSPHSTGLLASGGGTADRCIRFWNTQSGAALACHDTGSQVCNLAWSKTANEFVSTHGFSQNQIVVWKYPSMQPLATLTGHTFRVLYLAMSPDGQTIVTGAGDETLRFWNVFAKGSAHNETSTFGALAAQVR